MSATPELPDLNNSTNRRLVGYPNIGLFKMTIAYTDIQELNMSEFLSDLLKKHFREMDENYKQRLIKHYPDAIVKYRTKNKVTRK